MTEFLEILIGAEVVASIVVVLLLIALSLKSKKALTSERAKEMLKGQKKRFFAAFFFGVVALVLLIGIEIFEAGATLTLFREFDAVEDLFEAVQLLFMLSSQILILSLVLEVRRHGK